MRGRESANNKYRTATDGRERTAFYNGIGERTKV